MAKKKVQGTKQDVPPAASGWADRLYRRGILGVLLISLSIVTLLGLIRDTDGVVIDWWSKLLRQAFGWGSYVVVLTGFGAGCLLLAGRAPARFPPDGQATQGTAGIQGIPWRVVIGVEIVFLALLGLTHLIYAGTNPWEAAEAGLGGGYIGAVFSGILSDVLGPLPTGLILGGVLFWGVLVAFDLTLEECLERIESGWYRVRRWIAVGLTGLASRWPFNLSGNEPSPDGHASLDGEVSPESSFPDAQGTVVWGGAIETPPPSLGTRARKARVRSARKTPASKPTSKTATEPKRSRSGKKSRRPKIVLPSLDLLEEPDEASFDETDIRNKAKTVEETLEHFGVPAKVVEINWGPRVTQYGVEPGYIIRRGQGGEETERKIRVAKIAALSNDLALALAAAPVRIEAPVPGRSIVGIEVPNSQVSQVSLRRVMSATGFRRLKSDLRLALGEGVAGAPVVADLAKMPHLLIAGATGSGKSVCINAIATCLLCQNSPYTMRMVMIDPKRVELSGYNGVPHLFGRVESDVERIVSVLRWLVQAMEERYKRFAESGARHLDDYNRHWRVGSSEYLPRVVILIDELADLMFFAPEEVEHSIIRLAQMARATGMHLVIATQRPSVDVVTGLIKANFPARIGFAVTSNTDSRVILDGVGAETLLSKGDMLYMAPDASGLVRVQGCFVSDDEVDRVVRHWQEWAEATEWADADQWVGCPWEHLVGQESEAGADELLQQAINIVRQQGRASASLLQRRMHIGYPRASRLIDEMEERGVVGPGKGGGRMRQVLDPGPEYETEALTGEGGQK
jgi:S-DNA-T family DNA segregation ATPase FtsK/SpoIIIE